MDGVHDLGGKQGYGAVEREPNEPPFHEPWEGRVHGIGVVDPLGPGFRHAIELMGPVEYLTTLYYEHWLHSFVERGIQHGHFTRGELAAWEQRIAAGEPPLAQADPEGAAEVRALFTRSRPPERHDAPPARHVAGERVRVIRMLPSGHTRCPGYLRGAEGVVESVHEPQLILDVYENENGRSEPETWYTVAFEAATIWELGEPGHTVLVDLWERHLEAQPLAKAPAGAAEPAAR